MLSRRHARAVAAFLGSLFAVSLLTSCAVDHSGTVPALERARGASDHLPSHWDAELTNMRAAIDSSRLIGADSRGYEYFVTTHGPGGYCLIVSLGDNENPENIHDTWRANCSADLPVEVEFAGVSAALVPHGAPAPDDALEIVGNQVTVRR